MDVVTMDVVTMDVVTMDVVSSLVSNMLCVLTLKPAANEARNAPKLTFFLLSKALRSLSLGKM